MSKNIWIGKSWFAISFFPQYWCFGFYQFSVKLFTLRAIAFGFIEFQHFTIKK